MKASIDKYLRLYAEIEARQLGFLNTYTCAHAVVVPAKKEAQWLRSLFDSLASAATASKAPVLAILVLNGDTTDALLALDSLSLQLLSVGPAPLSLSKFSEHLDVLCVNRTGPFPLPEKKGVGLARKIGCDIALQLFHNKQLTSSIVHTTDADVVVPDDYFTIEVDATASAYLYPFEHKTDQGDADEAHKLYESFLAYYVEGLRRAGSPYAFQTVGSTMALSLPHYAAIRGFPRREAAEDFYVLNKLAKIGRIHSLEKPRLRIVPRSSDRVPFGTGQATGKLRAQLDRGEPYCVYDKRVFSNLKTWITAAEVFCETRDEAALRESIAPFSGVIEVLGGLTALHLAWERKSVADRRRHFHTWFDGFKTLRFVHLVTEKHLPKVTFELGDVSTGLPESSHI